MQMKRKKWQVCNPCQASKINALSVVISFPLKGWGRVFLDDKTEDRLAVFYRVLGKDEVASSNTDGTSQWNWIKVCLKLKTNKNTSGDFRRNELIQGGTAENPGAYFGAYCLLFRPESPLNSVNGIQFYVTLVPYKSMSPGIFRNKRKAPKTAWEPLQNLYSPVRIWMAPHEETLQNQRLQGFRFSPRRGSQEARGLSRGLLVILPFFLPRLGDCIPGEQCHIIRGEHAKQHIQPIGRIKGRELGLYHLGRWGQGNPSQRAQNKLHKNCEACKMNAY